ncbi:MAG: hypothetical protein QM495_00465 [Lutibacter sp.]|uniref:hypothetical protein n=1 Tax=Lutibacter sp. TaxID=1925666 RepID=UPI00385F730B
MEKKEHIKKSYGKWIFLAVVILILGIIYFVNSNKFILILEQFQNLLFQIIPILFIVYFIMLLTNYFIDKNKLKKYLGKDAGVKGWVITIISGILSIGPLYLWYPLMKDLQEKGVKDRFLVTFLFNRGIKLQWLPMLIIYFGLKYSLILLFTMAIVSIPQGIITEKLIKISSKNKL